eukprot:maker-scaffold1099_size62903-snap-gene-0.20 protein:Tk01134 transcript:maker-scaffold1099_size62903-snap-gene-0.20-mRNA-1 annotation:"hypothetical protein"
MGRNRVYRAQQAIYNKGSKGNPCPTQCKCDFCIAFQAVAPSKNPCLYNREELQFTKLSSVLEALEDQLEAIDSYRTPRYEFLYTSRMVCQSCQVNLSADAFVLCQCSLFIYCNEKCMNEDRPNHDSHNFCHTMQVLLNYHQINPAQITTRSRDDPNKGFEASSSWIIALGAKVFCAFKNQSILNIVYHMILPLLGVPNFASHFVPLPGLVSLLLVLQGKLLKAQAFLLKFLGHIKVRGCFPPETLCDFAAFEVSLGVVGEISFKDDFLEHRSFQGGLRQGLELDDKSFGHIVISFILIKAVFIKSLKATGLCEEVVKEQIQLLRKYIVRIPTKQRLYFTCVVMQGTVLKRISKLARAKHRSKFPLTSFDHAVHRGLVELAIEAFEIRPILVETLEGSFSHFTWLAREYELTKYTCFTCGTNDNLIDYQKLDDMHSPKYYSPEMFDDYALLQYEDPAHLEHLLIRTYGESLGGCVEGTVAMGKMLQFDRLSTKLLAGKLIIDMDNDKWDIADPEKAVLLELLSRVSDRDMMVRAIERVANFIIMIATKFGKVCGIDFGVFEWFGEILMFLKATRLAFRKMSQPVGNNYTIEDHIDTVIYSLSIAQGDKLNDFICGSAGKADGNKVLPDKVLAALQKAYARHVERVVLDIAEAECREESWPRCLMIRYFSWKIGNALLDNSSIQMDKLAFYFASKSFNCRHPGTPDDIQSLIFSCDRSLYPRAFNAVACGFSKKLPYPSITIVAPLQPQDILQSDFIVVSKFQHEELTDQPGCYFGPTLDNDVYLIEETASDNAKCASGNKDEYQFVKIDPARSDNSRSKPLFL